MSKESFESFKHLALKIKADLGKTLRGLQPDQPRDLEDQLLHLMATAETEEALVEALYGQSSTNYPPYRSLKNRFKERLFNTMTLLDFTQLDGFNVGLQQLVEVQRCYNQARIIWKYYTNHKEAKKHLQKALRLAQTYELHAITLDCLESLLNPVLSKYVPPKIHKYYTQLQETTFEYYQVQFRANQLDRNLRSILNGLQKTTYTQSTKKSILQEVEEGMTTLHQLWQNSGLTKIYYRYHMFTIRYHQILGNWQGMLDHITQTEKTLQEGTLNEQVFDKKFGIYMKTLAYLMLRQYQAGLAYMPYALQHFKEEENNYFAIQSHHLLLAIRAADYPRAFEILARKETLHNFCNTSQQLQEEWYMAEAYLQFITESEPLHFQTIYDHVPVMRADKEGMNLNLLILQLLLLLRAGELVHFERTFHNSFRALKRLPAKKRGKADTFFRLLHHLIKQDYHPARTRDAARHLVDKLEAIEPGITSSNFEIVPYSTLWRYTLGLLERLPVGGGG